MKIAIIGSGISGLVAAHHLHADHDVTVFEANEYIGGHTHTIRVDKPDETQQIDTGFIVYNTRNYPRFVRLIESLGVATQPTQMSFSVRDDAHNLEYNGTGLNRLFAQRRNLVRPGFYRMIRDILRYGREATAVHDGPSPGPSVSEYVEAHGYGRAFVEQYLVPLGAALWSCPPDTFRTFPMRFVVDFLANHFMLQVGGRPTWRVIQGGSSRYVEPLVAPFSDRVRLRCPVRSVRRFATHVDVTTDLGSERFDHAIVACHADQALRMLADPTETERDLLGAFPYQTNEVIVHTDASVLPRRKLAWAAWNARLLDGDRAGQAAVTYNMNILQSLNSAHTYCVTLNEDRDVDPASIVRRIRYQHPLFTRDRDAAQARHGELTCANRTSFCGAYWGYGFHEDGVRSAEHVVDAIRVGSASAAEAAA